MTTDKTILKEAEELIYGDRAAAYGPVSVSFNRIAAGWAQIVGTQVTAEQVGLMMIWLKVCRQVNKDSHDNLVDVAGYVGCIDKIKKGE